MTTQQPPKEPMQDDRRDDPNARPPVPLRHVEDEARGNGGVIGDHH